MMNFLYQVAVATAVKDRRIAMLEKRNQQLELEVESLLAEKQRKLSPVSPPDNRAWFLD